MAAPSIPIRERCSAINNHFNKSWPQPAGLRAVVLEREFFFSLIKEITPCIQMRRGGRGSLLLPGIYYCSTCLEIGAFIWLTHI